MRLNFIGNTRKYSEKLKALLESRDMGRIPSEHHFSADWPIALDTPNFHLAAYYGEESYPSPSLDEDSFIKHTGIDIQVLKGTKVLAPEDIEIMYPCTRPEDPPWLVNLTLHGLESDLVYGFAHLDKKSIEWLGKKQRIKRGEPFCEVGEFDCDVSYIRAIPGDVQRVYERTFDHLHVSTFNPGGPWKSPRKIPGKFNPLLLLKKLEVS